jgi:arylsulfatase A-like enzyme
MSDQPNILIIWGDDIGISNLSCYSDGRAARMAQPIDTSTSHLGFRCISRG